MILHVDAESPIPPYEQIRSQISTMAASGTLRAGARLPTIRQLAADLGLASGTVARAYRELEADGLVVSRRRTGTVVARPAAAGPAARAREAEVRAAAVELARLARDAGWDQEAVLTAVRGALLDVPAR